MTKEYKPVAEMTAEELGEFLRDHGIFFPSTEEVGKDPEEV